MKKSEDINLNKKPTKPKIMKLKLILELSKKKSTLLMNNKSNSTPEEKKLSKLLNPKNLVPLCLKNALFLPIPVSCH